MKEIIILVIFTLSNIFCVWLGAKIKANEPLYTPEPDDSQFVDPPDFVGADDE